MTSQKVTFEHMTNDEIRRDAREKWTAANPKIVKRSGESISEVFKEYYIGTFKNPRAFAEHHAWDMTDDFNPELNGRFTDWEKYTEYLFGNPYDSHPGPGCIHVFEAS